jgi:putative ABC transport system permease protein
VLGGGLGIALTPPAAAAFKSLAGGIFPIFAVSNETLAAQAACAIAVGILAAIVPAVRAARVRVVDGLRAVG